KNWKVEVLNTSETDLGGIKEVIFELHGRDVYSRLKWEGGGHRVQRVPETEAQGRIHTSAATVSVLPKAEEVDVQIRDDEFRVNRVTDHRIGLTLYNLDRILEGQLDPLLDALAEAGGREDGDGLAD